MLRPECLNVFGCKNQRLSIQYLFWTKNRRSSLQYLFCSKMKVENEKTKNENNENVYSREELRKSVSSLLLLSCTLSVKLAPELRRSVSRSEQFLAWDLRWSVFEDGLALQILSTELSALTGTTSWEILVHFWTVDTLSSGATTNGTLSDC